MKSAHAPFFFCLLSCSLGVVRESKTDNDESYNASAPTSDILELQTAGRLQHGHALLPLCFVISVGVLMSMMCCCIVFLFPCFRRSSWPESFIADESFATQDGQMQSMAQVLLVRLTILRAVGVSAAWFQFKMSITKCLNSCCRKDEEQWEFETARGPSERAPSWIGIPTETLPTQLGTVQQLKKGAAPVARPLAGRKSTLNDGSKSTMNDGLPSPEGAPSPISSITFDCGPMWNPGNGTGFKLRGPHWNQTREKYPSGGSLYECIGIEILTSDNKIDKVIGNILRCPERKNEGVINWTPSCSLPRIICVNVQLPSRGINVMGYSDPGWSVVSFFHIKDDTLQKIDDPRRDPREASLVLFEKFCRNISGASDEPISLEQHMPMFGTKKANASGLFKAIAVLENEEEVLGDQGSLLKKQFRDFNGTPVLITKSGKVMKDVVDGEWMEIAVDVRLFNPIAKTMLQQNRQLLRKVSMHVGFLVQAANEEDLPEGLVGDVHLHNLDLQSDAHYIESGEDEEDYVDHIMCKVFIMTRFAILCLTPICFAYYVQTSYV